VIEDNGNLVVIDRTSDADGTRAKGGKDRRVVALPASLIPEIARQLHHARAIWEEDQRTGTPLALPEGMSKKYPEFQFNWIWA
jgi:hypothetical protein